MLQQTGDFILYARNLYFRLNNEPYSAIIEKNDRVIVYLFLTLRKNSYLELFGDILLCTVTHFTYIFVLL
jgi:hypothetical protein